MEKFLTLSRKRTINRAFNHRVYFFQYVFRKFYGEVETMTYEKLFALKFKRGISTYELVKRYPKDVERVTEIALLEVPENVLKEIVREKKEFNHLMRLKRKFFQEEGGSVAELMV